MDLPMLRDLVRSSDCEQMVTVTWERPPPDDRSYFMLTSLLNESLDVKYVEGNARVEYSVLNHMAGIRHILPQNWNNDILATVIASPLYCKQKVRSTTKLFIPISDYFLLTDSSDGLIPVGQLSDGRWHTISIHSKQGDIFFTVDDSEKIPLAELDLLESRLSAVDVELDGDILLIDPSDTSENCDLNGRRKPYG
ncbi:hypothetical protein COOONC_25880 [Cooperia oncophora]